MSILGNDHGDSSWSLPDLQSGEGVCQPRKSEADSLSNSYV